MSDVNHILEKYKGDMVDILKLIYPTFTKEYIGQIVEYSAKKRYKKSNVVLHNNYTKTKQNTNLMNLTNYILSKEPIVTAYGVMFKKHAESENPLIKMIEMFMVNRGIHKDEMFKYPNGSEMYEHFNLLQSLDKVDCNAIYGILSAAASALYNIYVAASITAQGRSLISSATMFFEMFLSNNVKFASLEEVFTFINNVKREKLNRQYDDKLILDRNITPEECFAKLILTTGDFRKGMIKWIPDEKDMELIWLAVNRLSQEDINRIYYKNNLYEFFNNKSMTRAIRIIMQKMDTPFLNPNETPECIKVELETLLSLVKEYVFYNYQIIDRIDRNKHMIKNVAIISDTDSAIVSFDAWYHFVLGKIEGLHLKINEEEENKAFERFLNTNFSDIPDEKELDFDFMQDKIVERIKKKDVIKFMTNNTVKFSIMNIIAYICSNLVGEYMLSYTKSNHSYAEGKKCLIIMKNEFTFGNTLLTMNKKNYATIQQLQEGHIINGGLGKMDIKGLPINKSIMNAKAKEELQKILNDDVLMAEEIDQVRIIKKLAILEKQMYESLHSGNKEYYKPAAIKSLESYDDPLRIQGVKASLIWNMVRGEELEAIDLNARNTVDIVKVIITEENLEKIKDVYPGVYERFLTVFQDKQIFKEKTTKTKKEITSLAIPVDVKTPKWVMEFIDYNSIINDNMSNFPLESINIKILNANNVNYSNIVQI